MRKLLILIQVFLFSMGIFGETIVLKGGVIIDVSKWGYAHNDIEDCLVVIKNGIIVEVGNEKNLPIPPSSKVIDVQGKYLLPGLIDGFATLNNQAYANAYLYMGVTSIIAVEGGRRGKLFTKANPSPRLYRLEGIGEKKITTSKMFQQIDSLYDKGYKVVLLMYQLSFSQLRLAVNRAHKLGMGAIGELGICNYLDALKTDVDAFVHTTRYCMGMSSKKMRLSVANHPFSDDLKSAKWRYYKWLTKVDLTERKIKNYQKKLASGHAVLIPTLSLLYLDLPEHENPWKEEVARILDPALINDPADIISGNHHYDDAHQKAYRALALKEYKIEEQYARFGAKYLAGSATDVWGTMPGISLYWELESLKRIGLSRRRVLAAATGNYNKVFGWKIGLIKKGFKADILVLDKNPLKKIENLRRINLLIKGCKIINRKKLLER